MVGPKKIFFGNSPTKIKSDSLYTKCGWSPFEGEEFPGKVVFTIKDGKLIMEDDNIVS